MSYIYVVIIMATSIMKIDLYCKCASYLLTTFRHLPLVNRSLLFKTPVARFKSQKALELIMFQTTRLVISLITEI